MKDTEYPKCICGGDMYIVGLENVVDLVNITVPNIAELTQAARKRVIEAAAVLCCGPFGRWKCKACGKIEGGYTVLGRNIINVKPIKAERGTNC